MKSVRDTKIGKKKIPRFDGESKDSIANLINTESFGSVLKSRGDTLVGKLLPKGQTENTEERLPKPFPDSSKDPRYFWKCRMAAAESSVASNILP